MDNEKRLKSMQWLSKWDEYRQIKNAYVNRALELLKNRRRKINLITLMALVTQMKGLAENAMALKEYNIKKFASIILAIKMKVHYDR